MLAKLKSDQIDIMMWKWPKIHEIDMPTDYYEVQ